MTEPKLHIRDVPHDLLVTMSADQIMMLDRVMSEVETEVLWSYHCSLEKGSKRFKKSQSNSIIVMGTDEDGNPTQTLIKPEL